MSTKKVIIFSEDFPPWSGGIAQWAAGVAKAIHIMGHDVRVLTRYRDGFSSNSDSYNFPVNYMRGNNWKQLRSWYCYRSIKNIYRLGYHPDLIVATTWNFARGIVNLTRKSDTKLFTVAHGLEVTRKMSIFKKLWLSRTLRKNDHIVAVSQFTKNRILKNYPVDDKKISVIPNGVDISRFRPNLDTTELRRKLGLKNEKIILTLARVIARKGHDKVIEALPKIKKRMPNLKYIIAGNGKEEYLRKLKKLAVERGLEDTVIFTGFVRPEDIEYYYNLCDVYIMPSRELKEEGDTEGFGITFLEANACEKAVIGGSSGGVGDAIVDGETGFLADANDENEIADKLLLLLSNPELAQKLGKQGRARIKENYTWDVISEKILKLAFANINCAGLD